MLFGQMSQLCATSLNTVNLISNNQYNTVITHIGKCVQIQF